MNFCKNLDYTYMHIYVNRYLLLYLLFEDGMRNSAYTHIHNYMQYNIYVNQNNVTTIFACVWETKLFLIVTGDIFTTTLLLEYFLTEMTKNVSL